MKIKIGISSFLHLKIILSLLSLIIFNYAKGQGVPDGCYKDVSITNQNGVVISQGKLFRDTLFENDYIQNITIRYAADAPTINRDGDSVLTDREMDIYYPTNVLSIKNVDGTEIDKLPVLFITPQFRGDRTAVVVQAQNFASTGFIVVAFTYRSDFSGYEDSSAFRYCMDVPSLTYEGGQDMRAAVRMFSKASADSRVLDMDQMVALYGDSAQSWALKLKNLREDTSTYLFTGYSFGSTVALNTLMRKSQSDWYSYLYATDTVSVTGMYGIKHYGNYGLLDAVGLPAIDNYPFPWDKIKGLIVNNPIVYDTTHFNFNNHPHQFPIAFIHGTCDSHLPYNHTDVTGTDGRCDAIVTDLETGVTDTSFSMYGSYFITHLLRENGYKYEFYTFCGAGHNSGALWPHLRSLISFSFLSRAYCESISSSYEVAYKYDLHNFSNQCCNGVDPNSSAYYFKCDCTSPNPPIELAYYHNSTSDSLFCPVDFYCDSSHLNVREVLFNSNSIHIYSPEHQKVTLDISASKHGQNSVFIFNILGKILYNSQITYPEGNSSFNLPLQVGQSQILFYQFGDQTGKFYYLGR